MGRGESRSQRGGAETARRGLAPGSVGSSWGWRKEPTGRAGRRRKEERSQEPGRGGRSSGNHSSSPGCPELAPTVSAGVLGAVGGWGVYGGHDKTLRVLDRELLTAPAQGPRGRAIFQGQVPALLASSCPHRLAALTRFPVCVCDVSRCSESLSSRRGSSDEKHWISKPQFPPVGMRLR